jgi:hypothetical protein
VAALAKFLHKANSHLAQKLIPETTRQALLDQGNQIVADMKTVLGTL